MTIGKKIWAIPEGYIPGWSNGPAPDFISHDAACILNTSDEEAHIEITIYYTDREPVGPFRVTVAPRRSNHIRFNNFTEPETIPLKPNIPVFLFPMFRLWCNTHGWIRGRQKML